MSILPPLDVFFEAGIFEEDTRALVTVPGESAVEAAIIWLPPEARATTIGGDGVFDNLPRLALRVGEVPTVPPLTRIVAPPLGGGTPVTWIVRALDSVDGEVAIVAVQRSGG